MQPARVLHLPTGMSITFGCGRKVENPCEEEAGSPPPRERPQPGREKDA